MAREADARALVGTLEQRCELLEEQAQLREEQAGGVGDLEEGSEGPGPGAATEELWSLRDRTATFEKQEAQYQNRIAELERKNQELGWQVAMVAGVGRRWIGVPSPSRQRKTPLRGDGGMARRARTVMTATIASSSP